MDIRPFDGTLYDAQGILEVDRETFGDCDYTPEYIAELAAGPQQYVWVAVDDGKMAGFVSAFGTHSLSGGHWEIDELAVRPACQGRGLGTRLVAQSVRKEAVPAGLGEARALVATRNLASQAAFAGNGFRPLAAVHLLLYQISGRVPRPRTAGWPTVRLAQLKDAAPIAETVARPVSRISRLIQRPENAYLIAERGAELLGYAELIHVRTLQYQGFWVESLWLRRADRQTAKALFSAAIEQAKRHPEMDRVGYLAEPGQPLLYTTCLSEGFAKIDEYVVFQRECG